MNNGFSFTEVLLALLLGTLLFLSALRCHWFARQQLALSFELQAASLLLTEARHQLSQNLNNQLSADPVSSRDFICPNCDNAQQQQLNLLGRLLDDAPAILPDAEFCLMAGSDGPVLLLSWRSVLPAVTAYDKNCGSGVPRRQLQLGAAS